MKPSTMLVAFVATNAVAYPGMDRVLKEIEIRNGDIEQRSTELLGDVAGGSLSAVGQTIKSILQGMASAVADLNTYKTPGRLGSDSCDRDQCCVWKYIADDMSQAFTDSKGCSSLARGAIRLGFHDAATWDKHSSHGGADGSILLSDEISRFENRGLEEIAAQMKKWFDKYKKYKVGMADLIQMGATVATVSCPGGPRIKTYVGRKDESRAGPTGMLPSPLQSAQALIDLFQAKTFTASDLVTLVGAHTVSRQNFVDPDRKNAPQDSTPGVWDNKFYSQTLGNDNSSILIFPSDKKLATFSQTEGQWKAFAGNGGQQQWSAAFAQSYFRMSMLGVKNMNSLTDCTKVLPQGK
ncbi:heme peroxidase [Pseudomassariella vexata]|uniref:Peroxidase n=1 Tax=Pseudomassariella vexata TaxID=1141098 RepID=A0A1Y2DRB9_9PEZI|nr:heme peroxidase [Pseudomassariella vexata]ORY61777.1 heme peroxidase [Pseudomassariella vexata]